MTDTNEQLWRELHRDHGDAAARAHLAAGRAIYYSDDDTPAGLLVKEHPDGRRELVRFDEAGDEVVRELSPMN